MVNVLESINRIINIFTKEEIGRLDTNLIYYWDKKGNIQYAKNPIDDKYKVKSIDLIQHVRLIALLIVPRIDKSKNLQLLFKEHEKWKL